MGRACSTLSTEEIINLLTGDFRLSKAQVDDVFWEAVWHPLLVRGWNYERPNKVVFGLRKPLVFLIPGVHKFPRRDLMRVIQFFYFVSEVLSKVTGLKRIHNVSTLLITSMKKIGMQIICVSIFNLNMQVSSFALTIVNISLTSQGVGPYLFDF